MGNGSHDRASNYMTLRTSNPISLFEHKLNLANTVSLPEVFQFRVYCLPEIAVLYMFDTSAIHCAVGERK